MKVSVIIPAYNSGENVRKVLEKIPKNYETIVVDDGSTDNTAEAAKEATKVIKLPRNMGKGYACRTGIKEASFQNCIFLDGDDQLDGSQIHEFLESLKENNLVVGQREMRYIPFRRKISNKFANSIMKFITGYNFQDVLCGFRAVKKDFFLSLDMKKNNYCFESEMMIKAARKGKISTVNVSVKYGHSEGMKFFKSMEIVLYLYLEAIKKIFRR